MSTRKSDQLRPCSSFFFIGVILNVCVIIWLIQSIAELEKEMLNGQQLQGPHTAEEVNFMLKNKNMEDKYYDKNCKHFWTFVYLLIPTTFRFPLFTAIHRICLGELAPEQMIDCIRNHPEHM